MKYVQISRKSVNDWICFMLCIKHLNEIHAGSQPICCAHNIWEGPQYTVNIHPINGVIFQGMQYITIALIATHPPSGAYMFLFFIFRISWISKKLQTFKNSKHFWWINAPDGGWVAIKAIVMYCSPWNITPLIGWIFTVYCGPSQILCAQQIGWEPAWISFRCLMQSIKHKTDFLDICTYFIMFVHNKTHSRCLTYYWDSP